MKLIVNADDFGLTLNISKAIIKGIKEGILTDTNAIVHTLDFKTSADLALTHGIKQMGIHLLLTMGKPVLPINKIPSLVNEKGFFYSRDELLEKEVNMDEVENELEAQIHLFLKSGLKLNHINTHHGFMNKSKQMTELMIHLAKKYKVPLRNEAARKNRLDLVKYYQKQGIVIPDYTYFNTNKSVHTIEDIQIFLNEALTKYKSVEIGCHPGISDDYLRNISPLNDEREIELAIVLNKDLKHFIEKKGIERISMSDLQGVTK